MKYGFRRILAQSRNYKAVYQFPTGTTLSAKDSTSDGFNGTLNNTPTATTGEIDGGANCVAASSQSIDTSNSSSLTGSNMTVSAWVNPTTLPTSGNSAIIIDKRDDAGGTAGWSLALFNLTGTNQITWNPASVGAHDQFTVSTGAWTYLTVVQAGTNATVYANGSSLGTTAGVSSLSDFNVTMRVGGQPSNSSYWNGSLDEVRVSTTNRSADWIKTEYNNQSSPSTFYAYGALGINGRQNSAGSSVPAVKFH